MHFVDGDLSTSISIDEREHVLRQFMGISNRSHVEGQFLREVEKFLKRNISAAVRVERVADGLDFINRRFGLNFLIKSRISFLSIDPSPSSSNRSKIRRHLTAV